MRIGIFGGSFDPVHYGHLLLAELCRESCQLDEVRLVPPPFRPTNRTKAEPPTNTAWRCWSSRSVRTPTFKVWDVELQRGGVSYTVETLRALREAQPGDELFFFDGSGFARRSPELA